jgi:hypothetical protein
MRRKYLLGATENREIVFGEFEVTTRNGYPEFTASFDCVSPFKGDDYDLEEYYVDWCDSMDKATLYDMCERLDCSPSALPRELADECYDVRDALDCSLYPEIIDVDGINWYFESGSCGQHDTRKEGMDEYVNQEAYDLLHELWDVYHLKKVDNDVVEKVNKLVDMLEEIDEEAWIEDYIRRNF